jgi:oxygen-dependent protoporphyrinogen oxidase
MKKQKITIIGAGFSGLASAYFLNKEGFEIEVFEARAEPGGLISTRHEEFGLVETAANGILNSGAVEDLFAFADCEMIPTKREARARFIMRDKLRRWPLNISESFRMLRFLFCYLFRKKKVAPKPFETVSHWGERVLSKKISRFTIETALQGIYAGDPVKMSATLTIGPIFKKGPRVKRRLKLRGIVSARGGMGELTSKLAKELKECGVRFYYGKPTEALKPNSLTVIATSADAAAKLLLPVDTERANAISSIELLPIVTLTAAFPKEEFRYKGFGCLFPPRSSRALGVLMNNYIFEGRSENHCTETWIFGGSEFAGPRTDQLMQLSDRDFIDMMILERKRCFHSDLEPQKFSITRWTKALPHYTLELEKQIDKIRTDRNGIFVIGNYTGGIGLTKILDQAAQLPRRIEAFLGA